MSLFEIIVRYIQVHQKFGKTAADNAIADQNPVIVAAVKASFDENGRLLKSPGKRVTLMDLMTYGIKSPL